MTRQARQAAILPRGRVSCWRSRSSPSRARRCPPATCCGPRPTAPCRIGAEARARGLTLRAGHQPGRPRVDRGGDRPGPAGGRGAHRRGRRARHRRPAGLGQRRRCDRPRLRRPGRLHDRPRPRAARQRPRDGAQRRGRARARSHRRLRARRRRAADPAGTRASRRAARAASPSTATARRSGSRTPSRSGRCAAPVSIGSGYGAPDAGLDRGLGPSRSARSRLRCRSSLSRRCATRRRSGS